MIYSKFFLNNYNTNLILQNCISINQKKEQLFSLSSYKKTKIFDLINNWEFLLKYQIINLLFKILSVLNLIYESKTMKQVSLKFSDQYFFNTKLIPKNVWLHNNLIEKEVFKKYFIFNNSYNNFKLQNKKINFKIFKIFKKRKRNWIKNFLFVKKYWNQTHVSLKKQKKQNKLKYSWSKKKFIKSRSIFFHIYPQAFWNFFKWSKLTAFLQPIVFYKKFQKNFNYKTKIFSKQFFFCLNNVNQNNSILSNSINLNKNNIFSKKLNNKYKKKKKFYRLLKNKHYYNYNFCLPLYKSYYKYNPFHNKEKLQKKKSLRRQLRSRETYKKYFSEKYTFNCFFFNQNINQIKLKNFLYKIKNKSTIISSIFKVKSKTKKNTSKIKIQKYRNGLYGILTKSMKSLIYCKKRITVNKSIFCNNNITNLYKKSWLNFFFFNYLKIKIFKNKYVIKSMYKKTALIKKCNFSLIFFLKILNNKLIFNSIYYCNFFNKIFFLKNIINKNKLQNINLILY